MVDFFLGFADFLLKWAGVIAIGVTIILEASRHIKITRLRFSPIPYVDISFHDTGSALGISGTIINRGREVEIKNFCAVMKNIDTQQEKLLFLFRL
jgi:hypothetical protein